MKITIQANREWMVKATFLAVEFAKFGFDLYGERTRRANSIIYKVPYENNGPCFSVWGTKEHVRVTQLEEKD